jgi:hypothetical protein
MRVIGVKVPYQDADEYCQYHLERGHLTALIKFKEKKKAFSSIPDYYHLECENIGRE